MVLEAINAAWVERRPALALLIGLSHTLVGVGIALLFFASNPSVAMLFLATLLIVPMLARLLADEERKETQAGLSRFASNHAMIIKAYLFLFAGIFCAFLLVGFVMDESGPAFSYQREFLESREGLSADLIEDFLDTPFEPGMDKVAGILENNLLVIAICFLLSVFYGAGGIFLMILNASVFSSFLAFVMQRIATTLADKAAVVLFFSVHALPEMAGFLIAAIAGGVLSKAITSERWGTAAFRNVLADSIALLCVSVVLVAAASVLEVYVTSALFFTYF